MAVIAGLKVKELMVEMIVETAIVTANCRKNWPVIPPMKAHGTKTAHRTKPTATIGPVTSSIAFREASLGLRPFSIQRSTFSTTTMASSTTMPMAKTSPNKEILFKLNPSSNMMEKVPTMPTGTAMRGMIAARQLCRNTSTTIDHQDHRVKKRSHHIVDRFANE